MWVAINLFELMDFTSTEEDIVIAALILHDTWKHGETEEHTVDGHDKIAQEKYCAGVPEGSLRWRVGECIATHMGKWGEPKPSSTIQWYVHLCDYLSSRKDLKLDFNKIKC